GLLLEDAALVALLAGLGVPGDHVDLLHNHLALLGHNLQDLALLALVLAGEDDHHVVLANAHLVHVFSYPLTALREPETGSSYNPCRAARGPLAQRYGCPGD